MKQYGIRFGIVVDNSDPQLGGRIKVRLGNGDVDEPKAKLKMAYPLLPLQLRIPPKQGEGVLLFIASALSDDNAPNYYIGPIISNPTKIDEQSVTESLQTMVGSTVAMDKDIYLQKDIAGAIGEKDDVVLFGRKNSDIILGTQALALRHNVRKYQENGDQRIITNVNTPSAVILNDFSANIIANKINLIGNTSKDCTDSLNRDENNKYIASEIAYAGFSSTAHPAVFGDALLTYLQLLTDAFINHTHRMEGEPPHKSFEIQDLETEEGLLDEKMLSDNVHLN